jgi:dimethylglycine dehydrogenase
MRTHAQVVIVGGGIMGASLLYHLGKEGWTDCVLVEKATLTSGSTWHAAGLIAHLSSSLSLAKITSYGINLLPTLEAETGQSVSWHGCGGLYLAYTEDELDWLKYVLSVCRGLGHPMEIIGPNEIGKLFPFYNLDGVKAAFHTLDDGHVDPAGACLAFAAGARKMGAEIVQNNRVTDIKPLPDGEWRVVTELGDIVCPHVVNAGGTYARQIGEWVGLDLPITNTTHHYIVTETVPELLNLSTELPVLRDIGAFSGYFRMEQKSGLIGIYEKENPNSIWDDGAPWEAEHELFEPQLDRIGSWLEIAMERMPIFANVGIRRIFHGAIPDTPDGNMLLGPAPKLRNYWCCCGTQMGIGWGPGAGKYLSQWMVQGAAEISMREFDPRRYGPFADRKYVIEKTMEDYVLHRVIPFPGLNRLVGRPVKTSSLYQPLKDAGAIFEEVYGWEQPRWFEREGGPQEDAYSYRRAKWFDTVAAECRAVQERVGVMDLTAFSKIELMGRDSESFLNRMIANRIPRKIGGIVLSHLLNSKGTIEAEVVVTRLGAEQFYVTFAAFFEQRVLDWFAAQLDAAERVEVRSVSEQHGCLSIAGPRARDVLRQITQAPLDNASFPWLSHRDIDIAGQTVRALRISYAGELGWEIHAPMESMPEVYDAIITAGRDFGIENFGSFALNSMRLEKAFHASSELTNEVTLPEADVMRFVNFDKGDFIGREATLESAKNPLKWKCVGIEVDAHDADCWGGETIYWNESVAGFVSSGGYGHRAKKSLAFAYVNSECSETGSELHVDILGERRAANILNGPAYDPSNNRPRADG